MGGVSASIVTASKLRYRIVRRSSGRGSSFGFSLIELLVVVAIVALLIAILLPSLARAREQGKSAACKTNLRGWARAGLTYSADYNDTLVPSQHWPPGGGFAPDGYWYNKILPPYFGGSNTQTANIKKSKLWMCPTAATYPNATSGVHYGIVTSWGGAGSALSNGVNVFMKTVAIENPSATAFFADVGYWDTKYNSFSTGKYGGGSCQLYKTSYAGYDDYAFHGRHGKGVGNVAWYDGHVSSEAPVIPPDAPAIADMKAGNSGYLAPLPTTISWADLQASPMHDYYFFWSKTQGLCVADNLP